ncbi:hypothetical protein KAX22_05925 [bacterium]|nr:hypothetical protein [bacterium]
MIKTAKVFLKMGICAFGLGFFSMAWGDGPAKEANPAAVPTNLGLLRLAVEEAIDELCDRLPLHEPKVLYLHSESIAPGNWLVELALIQSLQRRDCRVLLPDSSASTSHAICSDGQFLRYRVADLDLVYPASRRKHLFGPRMVKRQVHLHLIFLLSKKDGEVLWAGEAQRTSGDWIPAKELAAVQRESVPFISPRLKTDGWGRFAEPALLTAAVGGLIYLFYNSQ